MSSDFKFTIKLENKSSMFLREMERRSKKVGNKVASMGVTEAKALVPVKTGALRKSISKKVTLKNQWLTIVVGAKNFKAHWIELGTEEIDAQPFLSPILEPMIKNFINLFVAEAKRIKIK